MHIDDYDKKVETISRYRIAKDKKTEVLRRENMLVQVKLCFDGEYYDFTLSGNEMAQLLSDFNDIDSIDDLFSTP